MDPATVEKLDALFAPWNRSNAPGLAVGIAVDGRIAYRCGFGMASIEAGRTLSANTRLRIGSTTKHFTALLALILAEEGKLDLDIPIRSFIPELVGPGGDPSIRQLLGHRGGSRCYLDLGFIAHGMATPPKGRALAMQVRQSGRNFMPGEASIYNNGGYHLVSEAIERVGGELLAEQMRDRLFGPLGMRNTLLLESDHLIVEGMATLHVPLPDGGWRRGLFPSDEVRGEGGIASTVDDMLLWMAHLRSRDRFGTRASWDELVNRPGPSGERGVYALGMMVEDYRGRPTLHHAGGVIGGSSQMLTFPHDGLDIVILANGATAADPTALAEGIADIVLDGRLGEKVLHLSAANHPEVLGHWWAHETEMVYSISDHDGLLKMSMCGGPPLPLRKGKNGQGLLRTGAIGDVVINLAPDASGRLSVHFGSKTVAHDRVISGPHSAERFSASATGQYWSPDADCSACLSNLDDTTQLMFADSFGQSGLVVEVLSDTIALGRRRVGQIPFAVALSLQDDGGLFVSTSRTRFLSFERR